MTNQEAIKTLYEYRHCFWDKLYEPICMAINALEQEPKTGHWFGTAIQGEIDGQIVKAFTCSECGAISVFRTTGEKIVNGDLCPNCGAKMRGENDAE